MDPALYQQIMGGGPVLDQQAQADQYIQDLIARRRAMNAQPASTGIGAALGGIADVIMGKKEDEARAKRGALVDRLAAGRGGFARAWGDATSPVQAPTGQSPAQQFQTPFLNAPDTSLAPMQDKAQAEQSQQRDLAQLRTMGMLSGDPAIAGYVKEEPQMALEQEKVKASRLKQAMEQEKLRAMGPQEALGGKTPGVFELLTKREMTPKFGSAFPGSVIYDQRTGKPVQGPGGSAAPDIIKQTADGIENGTSPPDMKGLGRLRVPVQAELSARGFNLSQANLDWQATQKHLAALNSGGQERLNQAINFVSDTIPVIRHLYAEWQQLAGASGFRLANKATLAATKQLPGRTGAVAQALETQINDFASELGTVYKGGGTSTDKSLGMAASNLQADWNPETFNKALELAEKNIAIRKNSVTHSSARGTSATNPYAQAATPEVTAPSASEPQIPEFRRVNGKMARVK